METFWNVAAGVTGKNHYWSWECVASNLLGTVDERGFREKGLMILWSVIVSCGQWWYCRHFIWVSFGVAVVINYEISSFYDGRVTVLTSTEVSEHIVALLREGHFVDGVTDVASLQQVPCILASFAAVSETFNVTMEPVHHF